MYCLQHHAVSNGDTEAFCLFIINFIIIAEYLLPIIIHVNFMSCNVNSTLHDCMNHNIKNYCIKNVCLYSVHVLSVWTVCVLLIKREFYLSSIHIKIYNE